MSDEDLELLITIDYPWYGPDEDIFHHLQADASATYWPGPIVTSPPIDNRLY